MTREIAHQQSFEKALYSIQPNFPPGKLPGMAEFTNVYFKMSTGNGDLRGPWNREPTFEIREAQPAVDGGDGLATVKVDPQDMDLLKEASVRLQSDPKSDPLTGAMLGMSVAAGVADDGSDMAVDPDPKAASANAKTKKGSGAGSSKLS